VNKNKDKDKDNSSADQLIRVQTKVVLLPLLQETGDHLWFWPELEVKPADFGLGVFACCDLKPGLCIPVVGREITEAERQKLFDANRAQYVFQNSRGQLFDGNPRNDRKKRRKPVQQPVACSGLSIALMINEPRPRHKANCAFAANTVQVRRHIPKGAELLVHYGDDYQRPDYKVGQRCFHTREPVGTYELVQMLQEHVKQ
jgi:hypothetical protein